MGAEGARRSRVPFLLALAVPLVATLLARESTERAWRWLHEAHQAAQYPAVFEVPRGRGALAIARELEAAGLLADARGLVLYLQVTGQSGRLRAGEYRADEPLSPIDLAEMLVSGRVLLHPFTVPEGRSLRETADLLAAAGWWSRDELVDAFSDPSPVAALDPEAPDLEGYLFPETYHFARGTTAREVAAAMASRFRMVWDQAEGAEHASALDLTAREIATIASLVEEETPLPQEHRLVASVYHNRLARGMKLECDPTVIHGLQLDGLWKGGPLLLHQLHHDSPYNTYRYPGLPPGPISSFGEAALRAALDPVESPLLFFVATGTGGHLFAADAAGHARNVAKYRRWQQQATASLPAPGRGATLPR